MRKQTLTAAWNVYNEEVFIGYSIMSVAHIADELLVVDHGSTDNTLKIVQECGRLLDRPIRVLSISRDKLEIPNI